MPKKTSPKGYARVDSESTNTHGWLVRILRGPESRSRLFRDKVHGGKAKAKNLAIKCYLAWQAELAPPGTSRDKMTNRNATGIVGVHLAEETDARYPRTEYVSYVASWTVDTGKRCNIRFLVSRYGKRVAFQLAKIAREKKLTDRSQIHAIYEKAHGPLKKSGKPAKSVPKAAKKVAAKKAAKKSSSRG